MGTHSTAATGGRLIAALVLTAAPFAAASADSGFYLGGSVGNSTVEANVSDPSLPQDFSFDESDIGYKVFGGFAVDLPVVSLGVEGGYVDLGAPSGDILGENIELDTTGVSVFGVAGIDLGLIDVFGKVGLISWEVDVSAAGESFSDDGSDAAYGVGLGFSLGSVEVRGEYEIFDISDVDDVTMLSVGLSWTF